MVRKTLVTASILALFPAVYGHDMWLQPQRFLLTPGEKTVIRNGNGTIYQNSENAVAPDRISGLVGIGPGGQRIDLAQPYVEEKWLSLDFSTEQAGNYWIALATHPRKIRLSGRDFTDYLEHDGIPNILKERSEKGISDRDEVEQYSKYVKTYLQVGRQTSSNYKDPLGQTIEIVPLENPYELEAGDVLPFRVLFRGKPLAGIALHAGRSGAPGDSRRLSTDRLGRARLRITRSGKWYVRGIHLVQVDLDDHSYESYWTTLTFEVR